MFPLCLRPLSSGYGAMEGNLSWHRSSFFLDQTGEINLHMVFPQYQILFKCLFKTSNGGACWERRNTSPVDGSGTTPTNTGSLVYQNTVWSVKSQVCYMALFAPEHKPCAPEFNSEPRPLRWCLILTYLELRSSGARTSCSALYRRWQPDSRVPDLTLHQRTHRR